MIKMTIKTGKKGAFYLAAACVAGLFAATEPLPAHIYAKAPAGPMPLTPGHTELSRPEASPSRGTFLVASRKLKGPIFARTVIIMLEYGEMGAIGLIVNRPTKMTLYSVLREEGFKERGDTVYFGGPVEYHRMAILMRSDRAPGGSENVIDDLFYSADRGALDDAVADKVSKDRLRVYAGYAGWGPGQLDREIASGDWHVLQGDAESVFDERPDDLWARLVRQATATYTMLPAVEGGPLARAPQ